jgi:site-specific DNA recombinase
MGKGQQLLREGRNGSHRKAVAAMQKKFVIARIKSGVLRGFFLIDTEWSKEDREKTINMIEGSGQEPERIL